MAWAPCPRALSAYGMVRYLVRGEVLAVAGLALRAPRAVARVSAFAPVHHFVECSGFRVCEKPL
jgi:hypothetical protein